MRRKLEIEDAAGIDTKIPVVDGMSGKLGRSVKSYQRTLKRKPSQGPWRCIRIATWGEGFVSFSFDGKTYGAEMVWVGPVIGQAEILELWVAARAVRVRVTRSCDLSMYSVVCSE